MRHCHPEQRAVASLPKDAGGGEAGPDRLLKEKAQRLRELHKPGDPVIFINVWDAVSARIVEQLGFPAIATSSAGIAWAQGFADGQYVSRERMLAGIACIARAVDVPVTADLERGYGPSVQDAVATAHGAIAAGAAGMNFEDWDGVNGTLFDQELQAERIAAIRKAAEDAGIPLVINARTDVFLEGVGDNDTWRLDEAARRCNHYLAAGADCAFVPGVSAERLIASLVERIRGPLNVLANASSPSVARLAQLGVGRISVGSAGASYALAHFRQFAQSIADDGSFQAIAARIPHAEVNGLFL